jgi:hypothetical protein
MTPRQAAAPVIVFLVACIWLGLLPPPRLHNLWIAILAVLYFPIYAVRKPWNGIVAAFVMDVALAALLFLVVGFIHLLRRQKKRSGPSPTGTR